MIRELISCIRNLPSHIKTAVQNIIRNNVMSFSSIFSVTITLLLIGVIGVVAINIQDMTISVEKEMSIYVKMERDTPQESISEIQDAISEMEHVVTVRYSTKDQELQKLIESNKRLAKVYEGYREKNPLGVAFYIALDDGEFLAETKESIEKFDYVKEVDYGGTSTESLINGLKIVRNIGSVSIVALMLIALFMISNTIKITIASRSTEISIMRMVGASNWYIRIPFMIEGLLIGLIGAIIPIAIVYFGYTFIYTSMNGVFISKILVLRNPNPFIMYYVLFLAGLGSVVGAFGSYVSIRKYLRF